MTVSPTLFLRRTFVAALGFGLIGISFPFETAKAIADRNHRVDHPVIVAVIDSGLDLTHPAFAKSIWTNAREEKGKPGKDDDGNGFVDDLHGWDFAAGNAKMSDVKGHGTHMAGIIAAGAYPGAKMTGVAAGKAEIMPLKVMDANGRIKVSRVIAALGYAAAEGAEVINLSLGFTRDSAALHETVKKLKRQGIVIVAAVGNSGENSARYPAAYPEVIAVGALGTDGKRASSSNFGKWVDLMVPGKYLSTAPQGKYVNGSGTSQAAAVVSGTYAFLQAKYPQKSMQEILAVLPQKARNADLVILEKNRKRNGSSKIKNIFKNYQYEHPVFML